MPEQENVEQSTAADGDDVAAEDDMEQGTDDVAQEDIGEQGTDDVAQEDMKEEQSTVASWLRTRHGPKRGVYDTAFGVEEGWPLKTCLTASAHFRLVSWWTERIC